MELHYLGAIHNHAGEMRTRGTYRKGYPEGAIVHFTAGHPHGERAVEYAVSQNTYCYFVIGPDGTVYQNFPLNRWGYHAGKSEHDTLGKSVSQYLVGIEVTCAGKVEKLNDNLFKPWFDLYLSQDEVRYVKKEQNRVAGWYHKYTEAQETSLTVLLLWLHQNNPDVFKLEYVLGHDEVSPGRKNDPGGSLSMTMPDFRAHLLGETGQVITPEDMPRLRYSPQLFLREIQLFQETANSYPGITLKGDGYGGKKTSDALHLLTGYYLKGDPRAKNQPDITFPVAGSLNHPETRENRLEACREIVDWEARRDEAENIIVYNPPSNDEGGAYEVAGINHRYHPQKAEELKQMVEAGEYDDAERDAAIYIALYTDIVTEWVQVAAVEAFLRDTAFNRGPGGAARVLQLALNVTADGIIGRQTQSALNQVEQTKTVELLQKLREAREEYELKFRGRRENFWSGLVNRWNKALLYSLGLLPETDETKTAIAEAELQLSSESTLTELTEQPPSEPEEFLFPPLSYTEDGYSVVAEKFQEFANEILGADPEIDRVEAEAVESDQWVVPLEEDGMAADVTSGVFKELFGYRLAGDPALEEE